MAKELDSKKIWESILNPKYHSEVMDAFIPHIKDALKDQGFRFDGEHIVSIEPEFKIEAGKWYVCIKPCLGYTVGKMYKAPQGNLFMGEDCFRPATEEEVAASGQNKVLFKKGDFVVIQETTYLISKIEGLNVTLSCNGRECLFDIDVLKNARLWDIAKDAKDGDVLYLQHDGKEHIIIYNGVIKERFRTFVSAYCAYNGIVDAFCFADVSRYIDIAHRGIMPATKEQRDLLFQKMKEAGYEWDDKEKKLYKLEDVFEPLPFGEHHSIIRTPIESEPELSHLEPNKKSDQDELSEFEKRLWSYLSRANLGKYETADDKVGKQYVISCSKELLSIARKQIASEIDIDAMIDAYDKENGRLNITSGIYRLGIEDTLKAINGE